MLAEVGQRTEEIRIAVLMKERVMLLRAMSVVILLSMLLAVNTPVEAAE
jgi:hypothetical protein